MVYYVSDTADNMVWYREIDIDSIRCRTPLMACLIADLAYHYTDDKDNDDTIKHLNQYTIEEFTEKDGVWTLWRTNGERDYAIVICLLDANKAHERARDLLNEWTAIKQRSNRSSS